MNASPDSFSPAIRSWRRFSRRVCSIALAGFGFVAGALHAQLPPPPVPVRHVEPPVAESNNNTVATATPLVLANGLKKISANLYPNGDVDFYSFSGHAGDRVYAATMTSGAPLGSSTDSQLTLLGTDGTTVIEFDDDNGTFAALSSSIAGAILPADGTYYIKVNDFTAGTTTERGYDLYLQVRSGSPMPEIEANDTPATANPGLVWANGTRNPAAATEQDWYAVNLNAGDTVFLSLDLDPERDGVTWNGRLGFALFGDAANQILPADDAGTGDVSPNPVRPSEAMFITVKTAGTYFAFVDSATAATGGPTATYHLNISVIPAIDEQFTTYTSTDVPKTLGPGTGLTSSTITIPGNPRIKKLRVNLNLNHALMQDLDVHLRSPAGNDIGLFSDIGAASVGGQSQMEVTFSDDAAIPPFYTAFKGLMIKPEVAYRLGWLKGENAGGTWTLDLRDDTAGANGGTLNSWSIEIVEDTTTYEGITLFSTDFESGAAGFTHSGTSDVWELGTPATVATTTTNPVAGLAAANSGVNCWKTSLTGTYLSSSNQDLVSPNIVLPATLGATTFKWAQWYQLDSAGVDHAWVEVREAGNPSNSRHVWDWLDGIMTDAPGNPATNIGASAGWAVIHADISDFAGKTVQLVFHLDSDSAVSNFAGLAIDDILVVQEIVGPTITSLFPNSGPAAGGTSVSIFGSGFTTASAVAFGATPATSFTINSDTKITAIAPAGTGLVDVQITNNSGISALVTADRFLYPSSGSGSVVLPNFAATTELSNQTGVLSTTTLGVTYQVQYSTAYISGLAVGDRITGLSFRRSDNSGSSPSIDFTDYEITAAQAAHPISGFGSTFADNMISPVRVKDGAYSIAVGAFPGGGSPNAWGPAIFFDTPYVYQGGDLVFLISHPAGSGGTIVLDAMDPDTNARGRLADTFQAAVATNGGFPMAMQLTIERELKVTGVNPASGSTGGGTSVTITGSGFTGATAVSFGGTPATSFTVNNGAQIVAVAPAGTAGTVHVTVTNNGETSPISAADQFTYIAPPTITGISPTAGRMPGGNVVIIAGSDFTGATAVTFGSTPATSFTVDSDSQITAISPGGTGTVDVRITTAGGTSATSAADQFTYVPPPQIDSFSPMEGPVTGGTTVTIIGTHFTGTTVVFFGGTPAAGFVVDSDTQITATSPAGTLGSVAIGVNTTAGGGSAIGAPYRFTYMKVEPVLVASIVPASPSHFGQPLVLTSVTSAGAPALSGNVTVVEVTSGGDASIASLTNVPASSISNASLGIFSTGSHDFRIDYLGDSNYLPTSLTLTQIVLPAVTMATITATVSGSAPSGVAVVGTDVTVTATVTAESGGFPPIGSLKIRDENTNTVLGNAIPDSPGTSGTNTRNYVASISAAQLTEIGDHQLVAEYTSGSGNFADHTSAPFTLRIVPGPSLVVTTDGDSDPGTETDYDGLNSLREAIAYAVTLSGEQTIRFNGDAAADPAPDFPSTVNFYDGTARTILLTVGGQLQISTDVTIQGPGADALAISGNDNSRVFKMIGGTTTLEGLKITKGYSGGLPGAAIQATQTNLIVRDCVFTENSTLESVVNIKDGTLLADRCSVTGNSSMVCPGFSIQNCQATISNTTFSGNTGTEATPVHLSALSSKTTNATLINTTISGNTSSGQDRGSALSVVYYGGAVSVTLTNCTVSGNSNSNPNGKGAIQIDEFFPADTLKLNNTIVSGNMVNGSPVDISGTVAASSSSNLIGTGGGLTNGVNANLVGVDDPRLAPLANNGGLTQTMLPLSDSPAFNAGSDALAVDASSQPLTTDQRGTGFPRKIGPSADIGAVEGNQLPMLTLPDSPVVVEATSTDGATVTFTVSATDFEDGSLTPTANPPSGSVFPLGDTTVEVSVADNNGGSATGSFVVHVEDTTPPVFDPYGDIVVYVSSPGSTPVNFDLPTVTDNTMTTVTTNPPSGSTFPMGITEVTATAEDEGGNTETLKFNVEVRLGQPLNTTVAVTGSPVIGATGGPGVPPADAKWLTFGPPAIDQLGSLAFTGAYSSATEGKGSGCFTSWGCLGLVGGTAPGDAGTFKTFSDPVIDDGFVASIVTLNGVPKTTASAIYYVPLVATIDTALPEPGSIVLPPKPRGFLLARSGEVATADGATFKAVKSVEVRSSFVAFTATLNVGSGTPKTTAATDTGIWVYENGLGEPVLMLREGQTIDGRKIKTLTALDSSAGSRGQGRGWLVVNGTTPRVQARVVYADGTQAIVYADLVAGVPEITTLIESNTVFGGGFLLTGGFGFPTMNALGEHLQLGTLSSDHGPAPAIFSTSNGVDFDLLAYRTQQALPGGAKFLKLQDPVLAADGTLAFAATLTGGGVKGATANTLWWRTPEGELTLLAQAGVAQPGSPMVRRNSIGAPTDLPAGAQFSAFTSLAIAANRGPIFTATLAAGKGGIAKAATNAVFALDFEGTIRRLFGVTDPIDVGGGTMKPLKSFTILTPTVGNTGVTRSFNDAQQITWRATFADKTQALITTQVP